MYSTNERGIRDPNAPAAAGTTAAGTGGAAAGGQGVTYGQSPASGPAPTTARPHRHGVLNKLDPRVDSTADRQPMPAANKVPEGTYGPHRSRIANALDPRVDSDMDGRGAMGGVGGGGGAGGVGAARTAAAGAGAGVGARGAGAAGAGGGVPEGAYGPHSSRVGNALDPRVDSDLDRRGAGVGATTTGAGVPTAAGAGTTGSAATMAGAGTAGVGGAGPHRSNLMNKLDPRVDSATGTWKAGSGPAAGTGAGTRGI